jgi:hypothetical protein
VYGGGVARPVPIPADLWARLAALNDRFDVSMERSDANPPPGEHGRGRSSYNFGRIWHVTMKPRTGNPHPHTATTVGADLAGVLELAVTNAEKVGAAKGGPDSQGAGSR